MKYSEFKAHPQTTFILTTDEPLWDLRCDPYLHAFGCDPFSSIYPVKKSSAYSIISHNSQFVFTKNYLYGILTLNLHTALFARL